MPDNNEFKLPETLDGLDLTALEALETKAVAAFTARYDAGASTAQDVEDLRAIAEDLNKVRAAIAAKAQDGEGEGGEGEGEEGTDGVSQPEPEPAPAEAPAPAPTEAPAEPALVSSPHPAEALLEVFLRAQKAEAPEKLGTPEVVTAGGAGQPPAGSPEDVQLPIAGQETSVVIVASADIPGVPAASELKGWPGLVAAISAKARSLPDSPGSKHPVASIQKPLHADRFLDEMSEREAMERMNDLSSPAYLLASGGWCAPSETIYSFACEVEAPPEMVVLPTGSTARGGVRFPISPTFRDFKSLENNGLFTWTEAMDIAAATGSPTKPCFKIPCVTFDEARLELEGLCVTAGNLMDRAYPELIRRYMSLVLTAHLHRMNAAKIAKMLAFVDDTVAVPASFAAASAVLASLELQVQDLRDQFSMSQGAVVEGMAPRWLRGPIRADVARRECCSLEAVSDADINSYLRSSGVMLQFVSNWQELGDPDNPATEWPEEVDIMLWLPGALRELTGPTLDIAVARDSVQNETNDFTLAFTEESYQVYKPGCGVRLVNTQICPSGASGDRVALTCGA